MNGWTPEQEEAHRRLLDRARALSVDELFELAVGAGIYTSSGKLTEQYQDKAAED